MITRLVLENFKCFRERQDIRFRKYTLVHGSARSGKSSILHAIKLILRSYLLDPVVRDLDYSALSVEDFLPDRDITRRVKLVLEGTLSIPYIRRELLYEIELSLSVSDGVVSTGVKIGDTTIPRSEMLQAMFSYICKEYSEDKYSVKFEAHYLTHSIFNVKVVYPRITVFDKELFIVLFQDIFPKILEENLKLVDNVRNVVDYSLKPGLDTKFSRVVQRLLIDPQLKHRVSKFLSEILGHEVILDFRRLDAREEYVLEDLISSIPISAHDLTTVNLLYIAVAVESTPSGGAILIDDYDMYLDSELLDKVTQVLVRKAQEKNIQLVLTLRYDELFSRVKKILESTCPREEIGVIEMCRDDKQCFARVSS